MVSWQILILFLPIVLLFSMVFLCSMAVYRFVFHTAFMESLKMFAVDMKKFVKELGWYIELCIKACIKIAAYFGYEPPAVSYPVYIGMDEAGIFHADRIESAFRDLLAKFETSYFKYIVYSASKNTISFIFMASILKADIQNDAELLGYLRKTADSAVHRYIHKREPAFTFIPDLTEIKYIDDELTVTVAVNPAGIQENAANREISRQHLQDKICSCAEITEKWSSSTNPFIKWGCNQQILLETGQKIYVSLPVETHPHALITGSSGSGKSYALCYLLGELVKTEEKVTIYFCDFKKSADFSFLDKYPYYYAGDDCYRGIMDYYSRFQDARESGSSDGRFCLIVDEYPAFVSRLQMLDKVNKTKRADGILSAVSELLMLGRGTGGGFGVWVVTQRPDASLFKGGSRDSFMITLAVGRLSREHKGMSFPGFSDEIPDRNFQRGEGLLLADGHGLMQVKFPKIDDIDGWKRRILENL